MPVHLAHLGFLVPALLLVLWSTPGRFHRSPWPAIAAIGWFGRLSVMNVIANIRAPHEWDYSCFWLYGHIAARHLNIYDPANYAHFALPFAPSREFVQAVINVGFPYPPPTIALFLPLGYIDNVQTGIALWYLVQITALIAATYILQRRFMPAERWAGAALILAIVLALPATQINIGDAQTNFLELLVVALALAGAGTASGAVWQMLAVWIKPFTAVLFIVDIVHAQWRRLVAAGATATLSLVGAALILGPAALITYIRTSPATREPAFTFFEPVNQSLLAVILRAKPVLPTHISLLNEPLYLALAAALLLATTVLCARAPKNSELGFTLALLLGMLIYPATLLSYGVLLVVPLLALWRHRDRLPGTAAAAAAFIALVTFLQGHAEISFSANLTLWLCSAYVLARQTNHARQTRCQAVIAAIGEQT